MKSAWQAHTHHMKTNEIQKLLKELPFSRCVCIQFLQFFQYSWDYIHTLIASVWLWWRFYSIVFVNLFPKLMSSTEMVYTRIHNLTCIQYYVEKNIQMRFTAQSYTKWIEVWVWVWMWTQKKPRFMGSIARKARIILIIWIILTFLWCDASHDRKYVYFPNFSIIILFYTSIYCYQLGDFFFYFL